MPSAFSDIKGEKNMQYNELEKLGERVSRLGFGCMRFPTTPEGGIDEPRAEAMLDSAYRAGVNYFDTAYFYHQHTGEAFVGRMMRKYPRDSFKLATKMPMSIVTSLDQAKEIFEGQLAALQTEYVDFYLFHALNGERWEQAKAMGIVGYLEEQQRAGRIRHFGFSFHDSYEVFEKILTEREWDFCQIQFNYMDTEIQAGMSWRSGWACRFLSWSRSRAEALPRSARTSRRNSKRCIRIGRLRRGRCAGSRVWIIARSFSPA